MQCLGLASQHIEKWGGGGQREDQEGQTGISSIPACYGELDVILGWTWPSLFPPRNFPLISLSSYFQECITGGSLWHNVLLLKHPERLVSLIEILSLSPTPLVALQDYCSSYSSVSKRLNHPLEKATVSQRRKDHLCSFPQETDFLEKKCAGWFLPQPEKELLFFQGDRWVGGQCCVSQELLSSTSTPPQSSVWVGLLRKPTAIASMKTTDICLLNPFLCGTICYT